MAQMATQAGQVPPTAQDMLGNPQIPQGGLFNLPGITYWTEQVENNDGTSTTLSSSTQVPAQFSSYLTNTDVLYRELMEVTLVLTQAVNAGTVFTSAYEPYNYVGPTTINMQNQFNTIDVPSGIDLAIFQLNSGRYASSANSFLGQNPVNPLTGSQGYQVSFTAAPTFTNQTGLNFYFDIPFGKWFDRYFDLDPDGQLRNLAPMRTFVTPQLMSGSNRIVIPRVTFNPMLAANTDNGPFVVNAAGPTGSGTAKLGFQRKAIYQPRTAQDTPILWGWQLSRETKQYSLSGRSTADILLPTTGQLLSVYYRLYDPSAASGGAPIAVSSINNVWLQYGSGLFKYQDTVRRAQYRWAESHNNRVPWEGVVIHDMTIDEQGYISNQNVLNTLDTSSCKVHFDFGTTLSNTAYVWIGVEALRYVVQQ